MVESKKTFSSPESEETKVLFNFHIFISDNDSDIMIGYYIIC